MATGKTAPLLAFPLESVAVLADRSEDEIASIRSGLECLGGAYQLRDDLIDLLGEKGRGMAGADLVEGKATLPVLLSTRRLTIHCGVKSRCIPERPRRAGGEVSRRHRRPIGQIRSFDDVCEMVDGLVSDGTSDSSGRPSVGLLSSENGFRKLLVPVQRQGKDVRVAVG